MAGSKYTLMNRIATDMDLKWRVINCINEIRQGSQAQTLENDETVQRIDPDRWESKWMANISANPDIFSRYNTAVSGTPPNENPGGDASVISDAVLKNVVKSVLGIT